MSIEEVRTSIFECQSKILVNPVNTVGVSGKGLALEFRQRFPDNYDRYRYCCLNGSLSIGKILITKGQPIIANIPTKDHWRDPSKIEWVVLGLNKLKTYMVKFNHSSVAIPKLGCGLGGLDWGIVKPIIHDTFKDVYFDVSLCI